MAGVAGCQGGDAKTAADAPKAEKRSGASVTRALTAAYKKTSETFDMMAMLKDLGSGTGSAGC